MERPTGVPLNQARAAKAHVMDVFRDIAEVVGVGLVACEGGYALKVNLAERPRREPPTQVAGVPLQIEIVGKATKR
jgi:hypothetical protein